MNSRFFFDHWLGQLIRKTWHSWWRFVRRMFYDNREYTVMVPSGKLVYSPWFDPANKDFRRDMEKVEDAGLAIVSPDRCHILQKLASYALRIPGDFAECGTYAGGTAHLLALTIASVSARNQSPEPTLHLFDSFEGMPDFADKKRDHHAPGDFSGFSLDFVKNRLKDFNFIRFHPGFIPNTFADVESVSTYAFVYVDVDIYPSVYECCKWFWPRMAQGGVMVFDDYGFQSYRHAARKAIDDYFEFQPVPVIALPTGQCFVIKA